MDPKVSAPRLLAPSASASTPLRLPGAGQPRPRLDDHLMPEEARWEVVDGQRYECMANEEHAGPQTDLTVLFHYAVAPDYHALVELTTRHDLDNDFTSDVCIKRQGKDPLTGERYLEELAFEVANTETLAHVRKKARRMAERGVRRVFAVLVKKGQLLEWSRAHDEFDILSGDTIIEDRCLRAPLRVKALLSAASADDFAARALLARGAPALLEAQASARQAGQQTGHQAGHQAGLIEGQQQALLSVLQVRGVRVSDEARAQILACTTLATLTAWLKRAATASDLAEVLSLPS